MVTVQTNRRSPLFGLTEPGQFAASVSFWERFTFVRATGRAWMPAECRCLWPSYYKHVTREGECAEYIGTLRLVYTADLDSVHDSWPVKTLPVRSESMLWCLCTHVAQEWLVLIDKLMNGESCGFCWPVGLAATQMYVGAAVTHAQWQAIHVVIDANTCAVSSNYSTSTYAVWLTLLTGKHYVIAESLHTPLAGCDW